MADSDVKTLMLQVDATVELLRRNLNSGAADVKQFEVRAKASLDQVDKRFEELGKGLTGVGAAVARVNGQISTIGAQVRKTEAEVRSSSGAIRAALLNSASALATTLSVGRVKDLADGYTRFTNQLKVVGLEGARLAQTQDRLYGIAQKYGVELESTGALYGRLSQSAKDLGASQSDLMRFIDGVGAGLRVQGGSAEESKGALLQLSQALGGTYVRAEEFNSINDGARPILQAVANGIDKYKGSVSALRNDVIAGTVTSKEFFQGFLKGSAQLQQQAAKANLTIGASFTVLNNALGKYIGQADQSVSATAQIATALEALANNLEEVAEAVAVLGVAFGARALLNNGAFKQMAADAALYTAALDRNKVMLIEGRVADLARAEAAQASAAAEVASIEAVIAARQADRASLAQSLALIETQRREALAAQAAAAENTRLGFGTAIGRGRDDAARVNQDLKAQIVTKRALAAADAEIAAAETALAAAQARANAATVATTAAAEAATLASRAAAGATKLLSGALTLIGGSVVGGAVVLTLAAVATAFIAVRNEAAETDRQLKHFEETGRLGNQAMAELNATLRRSKSALAQVSVDTNAAAASMARFAGQTGEAAQRLLDLAKARRHEQVVGLLSQAQRAQVDKESAEQRIEQRRDRAARSKAGLTADDARAIAADQKVANESAARVSTYTRGAATAARIPLLQRLSQSEQNAGRDVAGELAQTNRDLVIARKRGSKEQIDDLQATKLELTQIQKYRKDGLSAEAAAAQAAKDKAAFLQAADDRRTAAATKVSRRAEATAVRDAAADARAYASASRQADNEIAAARADLTGSAEERAQLERERIEAERANRNAEIATQGPGGAKRFTAPQVTALQAKNDERAALEKQVVDLTERRRVDADALAIAQSARADQADLLRMQSNLADTAAQRRDLELRILDIQYQEEAARLRAVTVANGASAAEEKAAQARLARLPELQATDAEGVRRQTAGPLDAYRQRLRSTVGDVNEALEGVEVNGLQALEDGLVGVVNGTESVAGAFKKMAASIISDLARIAIQKAIVSSIGASFFGFSEGGPILHRAGGGPVWGAGSATSDSIPAYLSNGEYVINAAATAANRPLLDAINSGKVRGFASGGPVGAGAIIPQVPSLRQLRETRQVSRSEVAVRVGVEPSPLFDVKMVQTSAQVVGQAAPGIVSNAVEATKAELFRPTL